MMTAQLVLVLVLLSVVTVVPGQPLRSLGAGWCCYSVIWDLGVLPLQATSSKQQATRNKAKKAKAKARTTK
jgi:hypothetical protein